MIKNILIAAMVFSWIPAGGLAVEKPPQIPREELSDPKSPSYVPDPFPTGRNEVIADYQWSVRTRQELRASGRLHEKTLGGPNKVWEMEQDLISPRPGLKFGEMLRAKDEAVTSPYEMNFVVEVVDPRTDYIVGYVVVADSGVPRMAVRIQAPGATQRLRREHEVRALFGEKFGLGLAIESLEPVYVRGDFHGEFPVWRVRTGQHTYYLGNYDNPGGETWYRGWQSVPVPANTEFITTSVETPVGLVVFDGAGNAIQRVQIPQGKRVVLDELGGFVHFLESVP